MSPLLFRLAGSLALTTACGLALSACDAGMETEAAQPATPATPASPSTSPGTPAVALPSQAELDAEAARITSQNADAEYQRLKDELDGDS